MKTNFKYGQRNPSQRFKLGRGQNRTWFCDNPNCNKVYHFAPYCTNTFKLSLLSRLRHWLRKLNFVDMGNR